MLSFIVLLPSAIERTTPICGCKSVGKPGYGKVFTVALFGLLLQATLIESPKSSTIPPISNILAVTQSKCSGIQFFINISPLEATAASINVPVSI